MSWYPGFILARSANPVIASEAKQTPSVIASEAKQSPARVCTLARGRLLRFARNDGVRGLSRYLELILAAV
jgi:hypothetical protein